MPHMPSSRRMICPTDPSHQRFLTSAHVAQVWVVDPDGDWLETAEDCTDITSWPDRQNAWVCQECGEEAVEQRGSAPLVRREVAPIDAVD
jgi:hypothetical protein